MPKEKTVTLENIPDDWSEEDVDEALAIGFSVKLILKDPTLLTKLIGQAKREKRR